MYVYISFSNVAALIQGHPTFFSRGPNLLFQKFPGPKFSLYLLLPKLKSSDGFRGDLRKKKVFTQIWSFFFCQKLREDQKKKKVFTQVLIVFFFCQKQVNTHTKKRSFRLILWDSFKSKYKRNSRTLFCNLQRQRGSINQPTDAETFGAGRFKPLAGHLLDAPALIDGFRSSVYQKLAFLLAVTILST